MKRWFPRLFEAGVLTLGLGVCIAALAAGHADDAPGVGLIGFGVFFLSALAAFHSLSERRRN